jgi:hypothetical protein
MEQLMLSSNQDLTGSKINGENIFVPSLEQTQAGFSIGGPIIKINYSSLLIMKLTKEVI